MFANDVTIQQGHGPPAHLQQLDSQDVGNGGFSRTGKAGEKHCEALAMARWIAKLQFACYLRKREPRRDVPSFSEALAQLSARDIKGARPLWHFIFGNISVVLCEVNHHVKGNHGDAEFLTVGPEQLLRSIRTVKGLASSVGTWTGMVSPHNEVATSVVFSNDRVPKSFPWACHAHGQRQQGEHDRIFRILAKERLITSHPD